MIKFDKPYLTGKEAHSIYEEKFKVILSIRSYFKEKLSHNFLFVLIANIVFFTLFAYLLPIRYEENDDIVMLLFASGKYTGIPEAHLVFINYIYGFFVSFLYTITSKVEWYTLIFTIIHILSLTVIIWSIATKSFKSIFKILFILLFYVIEIRLILLFQFTTTAALCALGGIALLLKEKPYQKVLGVLFLVVASLIRFEAALLVMLVVSPVFISDVYKNKRIHLSKTFIYLFVAVNLMVLFKCVDSYKYNSDVSWSNYTKYNKLRGQINDNPNAEKVMNNLPASVSVIDYQLFLNFIPDARKMDSKYLEILNSKLKQVSMKQKFANIYPALRRYTTILFIVVMFWLLLFVNSNDKQNKRILIFSALIFFFVLCYVSLDGNLKYRVFLSALMPFLYVLLNYIGEFKYKAYTRITIIIVSVFVIISSYRIYNIREIRNDCEKTTFAEQRKLLGLFLQNKNNSIVSIGNNLSIELYSPFNVSVSFSKKQIYFSGWVTAIPLNNNGFDSYLDLVNRHTLFLDKKNMRGILYLLIESIKDNYKIDVEAKIEMQSNNYAIVRLIRHS